MREGEKCLQGWWDRNGIYMRRQAIANGRKIAGVTTQDKIDVLVGCDTVCVKIWNIRSSIKHSRYEPHFPLVFFFFFSSSSFGVEVGPVQSATVACSHRLLLKGTHRGSRAV